MDRETTNVAASQNGFIDFIIKPSFEVAVMFLPNLSNCIYNIEQNKEEWALLVDQYIPETTNNKTKFMKKSPFK